MQPIDSQLDNRSAEFNDNKSAMLEQINQFREAEQRPIQAEKARLPAIVIGAGCCQGSA